jgi:hypothetical protein
LRGVTSKAEGPAFPAGPFRNESSELLPARASHLNDTYRLPPVSPSRQRFEFPGGTLGAEDLQHLAHLASPAALGGGAVVGGVPGELVADDEGASAGPPVPDVLERVELVPCGAVGNEVDIVGDSGAGSV